MASGHGDLVKCSYGARNCIDECFEKDPDPDEVILG